MDQTGRRSRRAELFFRFCSYSARRPATSARKSVPGFHKEPLNISSISRKNISFSSAKPPARRQAPPQFQQEPAQKRKKPDQFALEILP